MNANYTQTKIRNDTSVGTTSKHRLGKLDRLAEEIDALTRESLRDGVLCGILSGHEDEIRQDAILLTLEWLLRCDGDRVDADETGGQKVNDLWILPRVVAKALRICKSRKIFALSKSAKRFEILDESNGGTCQHHSDLAPWEFSEAILRAMALKGLRRAVRSGQLSHSNACVASLVLDCQMSVIEVARRLNISASAVYQQLNRIRSILPGVITEIEVPFL